MAGQAKTGGFIKVIIALVIIVAVYFVMTSGKDDNSVTVYCAHDSVYAESILKDFEKETGIKVNVKFDTEETKSLGLIELLKREKKEPRCDVFWNNEILGTMDLHKDGVLDSYKGEGWERIPDAFKDADGYWTGFGARMRVYILNLDAVKTDPAAVEKVLNGSDLSRVAIAKPIYGTTLTHMSILWHILGADGFKDWFNDLSKRGIKILSSNGQTRTAVAVKTCDVGYTDTDDFFGAKDQGKAVDMLPVRIKGDKTILIPNTVSVIKGAKNQELAHKLVDYLLSAKCEEALANSESRQIPLGEVDESKIPEDVRKLRSWAKDGMSLRGLLDSRNECLEWLLKGFTR